MRQQSTILNVRETAPAFDAANDRRCRGNAMPYISQSRPKIGSRPATPRSRFQGSPAGQWLRGTERQHHKQHLGARRIGTVGSPAARTRSLCHWRGGVAASGVRVGSSVDRRAGGRLTVNSLCLSGRYGGIRRQSHARFILSTTRYQFAVQRCLTEHADAGRPIGNRHVDTGGGTFANCNATAT